MVILMTWANLLMQRCEKRRSKSLSDLAMVSQLKIKGPCVKFTQSLLVSGVIKEWPRARAVHHLAPPSLAVFQLGPRGNF